MKKGKKTFRNEYWKQLLVSSYPCWSIEICVGSTRANLRSLYSLHTSRTLEKFCAICWICKVFDFSVWTIDAWCPIIWRALLLYNSPISLWNIRKILSMNWMWNFSTKLPESSPQNKYFWDRKTPEGDHQNSHNKSNKHCDL